MPWIMVNIDGKNQRRKWVDEKPKETEQITVLPVDFAPPPQAKSLPQPSETPEPILEIQQTQPSPLKRILGVFRR